MGDKNNNMNKEVNKKSQSTQMTSVHSKVIREMNEKLIKQNTKATDRCVAGLRGKFNNGVMVSICLIQHPNQRSPY